MIESCIVSALTGQGLGTDPAVQKKISYLKPDLKYCFFLFYTVKYAGNPSRSGPDPSPVRKIRLGLPNGTVGRDLFSLK
jgi:hypothetical protein